MALIDVDFSLAMHNRTGKYVIGRDLIDTPGLPLGDIYYWRAPRLPRGLVRRVSGRLQLWQVKSSTGTATGLERLGHLLPPRRSARPLLHLDPLTVPTVELRRSDIVLCHDVGPVTDPELFADDVGAMYDDIYRHIAAVGPHVVFVSADTKRGFERLYPHADLASARVIYPIIRPAMSTSSGSRPAKVSDRFLLTVGSVGRRKNQCASVEAFGLTGLASRGVQYVVCGGPEPGYEDVVALAARTPGVVLLPFVDDATLAWLYARAAGFVLMSRLEGFGMPVAEAMQRDLVPLVSASSVLEEVAGEGAIGVPVDDVDAIGRGMERLIDMSSDELGQRRRALRASLKRFDADVVASQWVAAFRQWSADSCGAP